nr:hypothetical protein B0A51_15464 [Rachicladosporium sp. CCFEE 5018]
MEKLSSMEFPTNSAPPIIYAFLRHLTSLLSSTMVTMQLLKLLAATATRKTLASYMSPTPLSVAPHRYTFLVYRQLKNYVPPPSLNYAPGARNNFDLAAYVKQGGLQGPVRANYYREGLAQAA